MTKRLNAYLALLERETARELSDDECRALREDLLAQFAFFAHERLIHLLVTLGFALFTLLAFAALVFTQEPAAAAFLLLLLVLLVPYIIHYYHLENGVQRLYACYDRLTPLPGRTPEAPAAAAPSAAQRS